MGEKDFFDTPLVRTKITSADVKIREMLIGYFLAPFCALISNAIFGSYLNRYYSDVIGWTDTAKFGGFSAILPIISVIFVVIGNLLIGRLIDNTRTSQGKARPYLLLSAPLVAAAVILLFMTPVNSSPTAQMIWIAVSYTCITSVAIRFIIRTQLSGWIIYKKSETQRDAGDLFQCGRCRGGRRGGKCADSYPDAAVSVRRQRRRDRQAGKLYELAQCHACAVWGNISGNAA